MASVNLHEAKGRSGEAPRKQAPGMRESGQPLVVPLAWRSEG